MENLNIYFQGLTPDAPIPDSEARLKQVLKLAKRKDIGNSEPDVAKYAKPPAPARRIVMTPVNFSIMESARRQRPPADVGGMN